MRKSRLFLLTAASLASMSAWAADPKSTDFEPSTIVPGAELSAAIPIAKLVKMNEREILKTTQELAHAKPGSAAEANLKSELGVQKAARRSLVFALGAGGSDALTRANQLRKGEKQSDQKKADSAANSVASGLTLVAGNEYYSAMRKPSTGSRTVGAAALSGAAYFASKGDRASTELAIGHVATLITLEQALDIAKNGAAPRGRFVTPRMGLAASGILAASLYGDVVMAEKRLNGEKSSASLASIITRSGLKTSSDSPETEKSSGSNASVQQAR